MLRGDQLQARPVSGRGAHARPKEAAKILKKRVSSRNPRVQLLAHPSRRGPGAARNTALDTSEARLVAFLDADDQWDPDKLALQRRLHDQQPVAISGHGFRVMDGTGRPTGEARIGPSRVGYRQLLRRPALGCLTVMVDRHLSPVRFPEDPALAEDTAAWLRILRQGHEAVVLPQVLATYRRRAGSRSANKLRNSARVWRTYRQEGLPPWEAAWCWASYAGRAGVRTLTR